MVHKQGWENIEVETDSQATCMLIENTHKFHPLRALLKGCRILLNVCKGTIQHTKREANKCADLLANLGVN